MAQTWRLGRAPTPPHYEQAPHAEPNRYSLEGGQGRASRNKITLFPQTPPGLCSPILWPSKGRATGTQERRGEGLPNGILWKGEQWTNRVKGGQRFPFSLPPSNFSCASGIA